jgi:predicted TIM-barrel fold metal-dependent hydrolase
VPWLMERLDQQYRELRIEVPWVKRLPSDHMRDSVRISTQPVGITAKQFAQVVEISDSERIFVYSSDYPHYDSDVPDQVLGRGLPDDLRRRISYQNAEETYPRLHGPTAS